MKRIIISIILILSILTGSALSLGYTKKTAAKLHALEENIRAAQQSGGDAQQEIERFCECWEGCYDKLSLCENANELETIDESISRLKAIARDDKDAMSAELDSICRGLDMMCQRQSPSLYSVL